MASYLDVNGKTSFIYFNKLKIISNNNEFASPKSTSKNFCNFIFDTKFFWYLTLVARS